VLQPGIHITHITPPETGWIAALYCKECRKTVFVDLPFGKKPEDGDLWVIQMCADALLTVDHTGKTVLDHNWFVKTANVPMRLFAGLILQ
jgi:hypothetical protein